ncbi:MAG: hypothetical protein EXS15_07740 [Phycisphaerales bacterium]|nr:hypothetical protein [Phycisphaerales bacterium]
MTNALCWLVLGCSVLAQQQRAVPLPQPTSVPEVNRPSSVGTAATTLPSTTTAERTRVDRGHRIAPLAEGATLPADTITVLLPVDRTELLDPKQRSGRLILFLRALDSRAIGAPTSGPFFEDPQPIGSVQVDRIIPGEPIDLGPSSVWWPGGPELLAGVYEVQAVLDVNEDQRGHLAAGNLLSSVVQFDFSRDRADVLQLELSQRIAQVIPPSNTDSAKFVAWVDIESPLLSKAIGKEITHKAAILFPRGYHDIHAKRRAWPTVYLVPGFGGRSTDAIGMAGSLANPALAEVWPQAVYVILDPESAFGHHGFVDSPANGPRGRALVEELIPWIEDHYRVIRDSSARVVTGHSSGGWSSVWLALNHPTVFGAAFASAPDPLDFSAFQNSDLYRDPTLFEDDSGVERASYRSDLGPNHDLVTMRVGDEVAMEYAISPHGRSGEQWDSWTAMFSPIDPQTGVPRRLCDAHTGAIDPVTVEAWSQFDIARRIRSDWDGWGRLFMDRVRVVVGERDSFYLERAAIRLRDAIDVHVRDETIAGRSVASGEGSIEIVLGATHDSIYQRAQVRFNSEIRAFFRGSGHHD